MESLLAHIARKERDRLQVVQLDVDERRDAAASQSSSSAQARCNEQTPTGAMVDCFSGPYHGTGYLSFYDTMAFKRIPAAQLHASPLWQAWLDDMTRNHTSRPCADKNAIAY